MAGQSCRGHLHRPRPRWLLPRFQRSLAQSNYVEHLAFIDTSDDVQQVITPCRGTLDASHRLRPCHCLFLVTLVRRTDSYRVDPDQCARATYCHKCQAELIGRDGCEITLLHSTAEGSCDTCNASCAGVFEALPNRSGSKRMPVNVNIGRASGGQDETNAPLYAWG